MKTAIVSRRTHDQAHSSFLLERASQHFVRSAVSLAVVIFAAVAASHAVGASTWHVRPDGSNNNCNGLSDAADPGAGSLPRACAFRTPQKGGDVAGPGDTVLLHAGTYNSPGHSVEGVTTILGFDLRDEFDSVPHRLTIRAAGDGDVIFDGGDSLNTGVVIWGTSYLTIEGIEMRRFTADTGLSFSYGAAGVNVGSPGPGAPSSFLDLKSLLVKDATEDHVTGNFAEIAIWCVDCADNTIESTRIESVEPFGIAVGSDSPVAIDQRGRISDTSVIHVRDDQLWAGLFGFRTDTWTVEGSYLAETANADISTDLLFVRNSREWTIVNSVFRQPPRAAINLQDDVIGANLTEGHLVLNDTIDCGGAGIGVRLQRINDSQVRNTIVTSCDAAVLLTGDLTNTELGFNDLFDDAIRYNSSGIAFGFTLVDNDLTDDPLFQGVAPRPDPFYRLSSGSPAIDAGDDANCGTIPDDDHCDIGAFQFAGDAVHAPSTPSIVSVDTITGRTAVLHGSAFSDPDPGDVHAASQWQVDLVSGDFSHPVHDSGRTTLDLTSHRVTGLSATTTYKSRVRYEDADGHVSEWSDPVSDAGDQFTTLVATALPPKVVSVDPRAGKPNVSVSTTITLHFNVPVDFGSVTSTTVRILADGVAVTQAGGSPSVQGDGSVVVVTPAGLLDPNTKYKVEVLGGVSGVLSRDGEVPGKDFKSNFTTETALASSDPSSGENGVSIGVSPQLVFKWNVSAATATTNTVVLRDVTSGRGVPLASVSTSGTTVTLVPAAPLRANHKHQITVVSGVLGLRFSDGRKLGKALKVTFKTGSS